MRNNSAEVLRRVEAGETIIVTNRGRPVAQLAPVKRSVIDELIERGEARPALHGPEVLRNLAPVTSDLTSEEILADVRGYERGY